MAYYSYKMPERKKEILTEVKVKTKTDKTSQKQIKAQAETLKNFQKILINY